MTKREGAVLSAFTGIMLCDFIGMHKYCEELLGRPILDLEFGNEVFANEIKNKARRDAMQIISNQK